jgi:hypothetical protein
MMVKKDGEKQLAKSQKSPKIRALANCKKFSRERCAYKLQTIIKAAETLYRV